MSRMEKAQEPSMEDILASIRKIIAEEPIGTRQNVAQAASPAVAKANPVPQNNQIPQQTTAVAPQQAAPTPRQPAPQREIPAPRRPSAQPAAMDDVLSLADDLPTMRPSATGANSRPSTPAMQAPIPAKPAGAELSQDWALPKPAQPAVPAPARPLDQQATTRAQVAAASPAPAPFFGGEPAKNGALQPASTASAASAQVPAHGDAKNGLSDLGSFVPGRFNDVAPAGPAPRQEQPSLSGLLNGSARPAQPLPAGQPAGTNGAVRSAPAGELNGTSGHGHGPGGHATSSGQMNGSAPTTAQAPRATAARPPERKPEPAPLKSRPLPEPKIEAKPVSKPAVGSVDPDVVTQPYPQPSAKPAVESEMPSKPVSTAAAASSTKVEAPVVATPPVATVVADKAPVVEAEANAPVLLGTPLPAPVVVTPKPVATAASAMPAMMSSVEERVVELLRPMIREWLDNNMPRMVEKALSIELAASAKPKGPSTRN